MSRLSILCKERRGWVVDKLDNGDGVQTVVRNIISVRPARIFSDAVKDNMRPGGVEWYSTTRKRNIWSPIA